MERIVVPKDLEKAEMYAFAKEKFPEGKFSHLANPETTIEKMQEYAKEQGIELVILPSDMIPDSEGGGTPVTTPDGSGNKSGIEEVKIKTFYTLNTGITDSHGVVYQPGTRLEEDHVDFEELIERKLLDIDTIKL